MPRPKKKAPKRGGKPRTEEWTERRGSGVTDMVNERFEAYYKTQHIVADDEWDAFMRALRQPLPSTFRIAGNRQMAHVLNDSIKSTYVPQLQSGTFEGEALPVPIPIPWYPDGLAWQINVARKALRKSADYKKFHNFLVFETEVGNISRQEAVSMLPPLFLDVEPHHWVIDMCAAPGSKTAQLLEAFHANDGLTNASAPSGLLIANDSDHKRTHLLIHQSSRLPSPALMVTNLDASIYPAIQIPAEIASASQGKSDSEGRRRNWRKDRQKHITFDRILCDVPCSGDGTIRKNLGIWKSWQPLEGNGLHGLQLRILQRAMKMLKDDGRIVYSTCSLNPVENEAVVAAALNSSLDFELIDVSDRLPALIRRPGLTSWRPSVDRALNMDFTTHAEYTASLSDGPDVAQKQQPPTKMVETHWPPANVQELGLEHCLRVYPHLQDSGGFFVAVLQKKRTVQSATVSTDSTSNDVESATLDVKRPANEELPSPALKKVKLADDGDSMGVNSEEISVIVPPSESATDMETTGKSSPEVKGKGKGKKTKQASTETGGTFKEQPFTFIPADEPSLQACITRLNLKPDFPAGNLFVRQAAGEPLRSLYLVNDIVKAVIQSIDYTRIRLVSAGVKVFGKSEGAKYLKEDAPQIRVLSEGMPAVLPYIKHETLINGDLTALRTLMQAYNPLSAAFAQPFASVIEDSSVGSHIVCFKAGQDGAATLTHDLILPLWKSDVSVSLMIDKKAKSALSLRLFGEDITFVGRQTSQKPHRVFESAEAVAAADSEDDELTIDDDKPGDGATEQDIIIDE